jgi:beta-galactosidase
VIDRDRDQSTIVSGANSDFRQSLNLASAHLWSCEHPYLYRLRSTVSIDRKPVDQVVTQFGVRTFQFDVDQGFLLNGQPVKIKGVCNHQDFAGVGVALPDGIHEFRVRRLKDMGANAWRCSHHPMAPELLEACDRLGMLVLNENRHLGDSAEILSQLESLVLRDRNHPSVILWSLCNEEKEQGTQIGARQAQTMIEVVRRLDPSRPITAAMNGGFGSGLTDVIDLQGFNYHPQDYDAVHRKLPGKPLIATETAAEVSTRGCYDLAPFTVGNENYRGNQALRQLAAYGVNAPGWAQTAEVAWQAVADRPWMAGCFVWTGFDYRGEPTPFGWPCVGSQFGILDQCGFPKDSFYYYQARWSDQPVLHLFPHWNWSGREGQEIDVWIHSNCQTVELFLNGASLGRQTVPSNRHLEWKVRYAPGRLMARGVRDGRTLTARVETTGIPAAISLEADQRRMTANGADVALVTVRVLDDRGRPVPTASNEVAFTVKGAGHLLGVGNGDPTCHEPDKASRRRMFNGLCLAILQASHAPGILTLQAESANLRPATLTLRVR